MSRKIPALMSAATVGLVAAAPGASAFNYSYGDLNMSLDTRLKEAVAVRIETRDPLLIALNKGGKAYSSNADDGDLNFGTGAITEAASTITSSLKLTYSYFGIFTRANYTYDPRLQSKDFFNETYFGPGHQFGPEVAQAANRGIHDHIGSDGTVADLYAYTNFDIWGRSVNIRVGRQVVNWGETTIVLNGLNSINALDANKARIPASTFEDVFIPSNMVFSSVNLFEDMSVEGWYQLKWEKTLPDATGSYFSTNDYVSNIGGIAGNLDFGRAVTGEYALAGTPCYDPNTKLTSNCVPYGGSEPRGVDGTARNGGQFGGALRFQLPWLNDTSLAFYAANYHSRLPVYSSISAATGNVDSLTARVFAEYPENIRMYGTSFNTSLPLGWSLQGEYSYRPNVPVELDDVEQSLADLGAPSQLDELPGQTLGNQYIRGWRRKPVHLFDLGTTKILAPNPDWGYDDLTLLGEVAVIHVSDLEDPSKLLYEGPGTFLPGTAQSAYIAGLVRPDGSPILQPGGFATGTSWGFKFAAIATYNNVVGHLNLKPALRFDDDVRGVTPQPLGNFVRGSRLMSPIMGFQYGEGFTADIGYNYYFGGGQNNLVRDRDYLWFALKYDF